jgi:hypothetical protein
MVDVAESLNGELPKIIHPGWQTLSMTDRARICTALIEARWALCRRLLRAAILDCRPVDDALHQHHAHMNVAGNIGQEFGVSGRGKSAPPIVQTAKETNRYSSSCRFRRDSSGVELVRNQLANLSLLECSWKVAGETSELSNRRPRKRFSWKPNDSNTLRNHFRPVLFAINRPVLREVHAPSIQLP